MPLLPPPAPLPTDTRPALPPTVPALSAWVHRTPAGRVVFGAGSIAGLGAELAGLGLRRPLVLSGARTAASPLHAAVRSALVGVDALWFSAVPAHSSVEVVAQLVALARAAGVDGLVAVGGGSASDTAKATALWLAEGGALQDHASRFTPPDQLHVPLLSAAKLPIVAVPGTASAAEVTPSLGIRTAQGHKLLFSDSQLAARLIVIDPQANLGVAQAALAPMAAQVMHERGLYFNPRPVRHAAEIEALLDRAW